MSEQERDFAWNKDCEATLVAIAAQLAELPGYEHRMNVMTNVLRGVMTDEVVKELKEVTGSGHFEMGHLVLGLEFLTKELVEALQRMPQRLADAYNAEMGCGHCDTCKAAKRAAYADGAMAPRPKKSESRQAVDQLIATMLGGSTKH